MKKALIAFGMLLMTTPVYAGGLVSKHAASVQLSVDAARTTASRIGSTFSISGSNIDTTDVQLPTQFLPVLSLMVFIHQERLLPPKLLQEQHSPSVNLIHRLMQSQLVLLL